MITFADKGFELEDGRYMVYVVMFEGNISNVVDQNIAVININGSEESSLWGFLEMEYGTEDFYISGIVKGK